MKNNAWTEEEDVLLAENYLDDWDSLCTEFPRHKSWRNIAARINKLGLRRRLYWTKDEDQILIDNYEKIREWDSLLLLLPRRTIGGIAQRAKQLGLDRRHFHTKYECNHNFFGSISPLTSYWCGFITADGHLCATNNQLVIGLAEKDKCHLERFILDVGYTGVLSPRLSKEVVFMGRYCKGFPGQCLQLNSKQILEDLCENFCLHRGDKTYTKIVPPEHLSDDQFLAWAAGLLDGDGSISRRENPNSDGIFSFSAGWLAQTQLLEWIRHRMQRLQLLPKKVKFSDCSGTTAIKQLRITGANFLRFAVKVRRLGLPLLERKWRLVFDHIDRIGVDHIGDSEATGRKFWSLGEDQLLKDNSSIGLRALCALLPRHSSDSIRYRRYKLNLPRYAKGVVS